MYAANIFTQKKNMLKIQQIDSFYGCVYKLFYEIL